MGKATTISTCIPQSHNRQVSGELLTRRATKRCVNKKEMAMKHYLFPRLLLSGPLDGDPNLTGRLATLLEDGGGDLDIVTKMSDHFAIRLSRSAAASAETMVSAVVLFLYRSGGG